MYEFKMPSLGADMVEGTLTKWMVEVGDSIERGEVICEVETNKGDIEVEVWEGGVVEELRVESGEKVPVGEVIAVLDTGAEEEEAAQEEEEAQEEEAQEEEAQEEEASQVAVEKIDPADLSVRRRVMASPAARRRAAELGIALDEVRGSGSEGAITAADVERTAEEPEEVETRQLRVSPVARRLAREAGVDLDELEGSGPHGAIRREDVEAAVRAGAGDEKREAEVERRGPQAAMREAIAIAMARSKREIPHYYLHETVPMERAMTWLRDYNADRPAAERLLPAVLFVKAVALACGRVPEMNGLFEDEQFHPREDVNPGFAISLREGGVIPPAIHSADKKELPQLMADIRDLVQRVRRGKLRSSEITEATITITSLGDMGVEAVYGVIYPPQVAIVGFGRITDRLMALDGLFGVRPCVTVTLSGDHRVSDGMAGARFLAEIRELLQHPEEL